MAFLRWLFSWLSDAPVDVPGAFSKGLVITAMAECGKGEATGNNQGPDVVRYRRGKKGKGSWCAAFVSWCIEETAHSLGVDIPVARSHGARRLFKNAIATGERCSEPERGMLALWDRGVVGSWQAHIGIVHRVEPDGTFYCIEGNRGKYPAKVDIFKHQLGEPRLLGFARIGRAG